MISFSTSGTEFTAFESKKDISWSDEAVAICDEAHRARVRARLRPTRCRLRMQILNSPTSLSPRKDQHFL